MKKIYLENRYGSGDGPTHDLTYDYLLFRQNWGGQESIFFNKEELDSFAGKINTGEILVHPNYSILYCRTQELLDEVKDEFGCYEVLMPTKT